jgi:hypothetical protein
VEFYSAMKNVFMSFAGKWMGLKMIKLSKPDPQRQVSHIFLLMWNLGEIKDYESAGRTIKDVEEEKGGGNKMIIDGVYYQSLLHACKKEL